MGISTDSLSVSGFDASATAAIQAIIAPLDELEVVDDVIRPKASMAAYNFAIGTEAEASTATGDDDTGDFENTGANLSHDGTAWSNDLLEGSDLTSAGYTNTDFTAGTGNPEDQAVNDVLGTWIGAHSVYTTTNGASLEIDLGSDQSWQRVKLYLPSGGWELDNGQISIYYAVDDGGSPDTYQLAKTFSSHSYSAGGWSNFTLDSEVTGRFMKFVVDDVGGNGGAGLTELEVVALTLASSSNTVDASMSFTGTKSFAPATLVVKDESDVNITEADNCNIDYNKNGAGFIDELIDITAFRELPVSTFADCTSLKLRIQPVGDQTVKEVKITPINSALTLTPSGDVQKSVNGITAASLVESTRTITESDDIEIGDDTVIGDATSDSIVATLPAAEDADGNKYTVLKSDSSENTVTVDGDGAETINGSATQVLSSQYDFIVVQSDGTEWFVIGGNI